MPSIDDLLIEVAKALADAALSASKIDGIAKVVLMTNISVEFTDSGPIVHHGMYTILGDKHKHIEGIPTEPMSDEMFNLLKDVGELGDL